MRPRTKLELLFKHFLVQKQNEYDDFVEYFEATFGERPDGRFHRRAAEEYDLMVKASAVTWGYLTDLLNEGDSGDQNQRSSGAGAEATGHSP
jgi:hypothetical protein